MKTFFLGLLGLAALLLGIFVLAVLSLLALYGFGWSMGWAMLYIIDPITIGGVTLPQIMGLLSVFSGMIAGGIGPFFAANKNSTKIEKAVADTITEKFKEYRGY